MNLISAAGYGLIFTLLFFVVMTIFLGMSRVLIDWFFETFPNLPLIVPYALVWTLWMFIGVTLVIYVEGKV